MSVRARASVTAVHLRLSWLHPQLHTSIGPRTLIGDLGEARLAIGSMAESAAAIRRVLTSSTRTVNRSTAVP